MDDKSEEIDRGVEPPLSNADDENEQGVCHLGLFAGNGRREYFHVQFARSEQKRFQANVPCDHGPTNSNNFKSKLWDHSRGTNFGPRE